MTSLPAALRHQVYIAISHAVQGVFVWVVPASVLIFVLALFIKEVPLRSGAPDSEQPAAEPELVG